MRGHGETGGVNLRNSQCCSEGRREDLILQRRGVMKASKVDQTRE